MGELESLLAQVDAIRDDLIAFHQEIVRIPTINTGVMPTGNETPCCRYIQQRLSAEGIPSEILESAPGRGNLIARLEGEGSGPSLQLMSHLDVVPVGEESGWRYPPFSAVLADGNIWGRGSDDCKAVTTAAFFATVLLKRSGVRRRGDLVFTGTADEESGGFYGYGWLARNAPEKIHTDYALNEGGGGSLLSREGPAYGLSLGEKGRLEITISISGRGGHAANPWAADNALAKAGRVLTAIAAYQPEIDLSHPIFQHLGRMVEGLENPTPQALEAAMPEIERASKGTAKLLLGLSRMSLTPTILRAGEKSNSIPASAVLKCDARTLPGQDVEYVRGELNRILEGIDGVDVNIETWARSTQSPFDTPFTRMLQRALGLAVNLPEVRLVPSSTIGFTDSQYVRPLGVQAYGFAPTHPEAATARPGVHGVDEYVEVDTLLARTKAYLAAAYLTVVEGLSAD